MATHSLSELLPANVFAVTIVMARVAAAITFLPGFGATYVPGRVKAVLALFIAVAATPVLAPGLPPPPKGVPGLVALIGAEAVIGAFIGLFANLLIAALDLAGAIMAMQSNLSSALVFNPGEMKQETLPAGLLSALAIVLIFATDMDHLLLKALVDSYQAFPPGGALPFDDMAQAIMRVTARGFEISMQIAAPYLVLGTLFYFGLGVLGRIMPQLQIFYVGLPLQVLGGLSLLLITVPASILWFLGTFEGLFESLTRPP